MPIRVGKSTLRILASGLVGLALVAGGASALLARHEAAASPQAGARSLPGHAVHGAFRTGEVNLATLPAASVATTRPGPKATRADRLLKTPAQRAAYRQWALTHPGALPKAAGVGSGPGSVGTIQPNIYGGAAIPALLSSAAGLTSVDGNDWYPPDQAIAAAPGYVFEGVNNVMEVYTTAYAKKYGPWTPDQLFASVKHTGDVFGDPQITFDAERAVYLISWLEINPTTGADSIDLAVSLTSTPSPLTNFRVYQIPASTTGSDDFCDYPTLGYDYWGAYVTCITFSVASGVFTGNRTYAFDINKLLTGSVVLVWYGNVLTALNCSTACTPAFRVSPAMEDGVPQAEWLSATDVGFGATSSNLTLCALTNTHALETGGTPTASCSNNTLPAAYTDSMGAPQPGTATTVYPGDGYKQIAYRNGQLYFAFPEAVSCGGSAVDGIYWAAVDPQLSTIAAHNPQQVAGIVSAYTNQGVFCFTGGTDNLYMPSLVAGTEGDMALVFNDSGPALAPSVYYTGRAAADAPGTMGQGSAWKAVVTGTNSNDSGRWGDYSACALTTNLVTRGIVYCGGEFGGPNTALGGFGWDTELYALRME
ncbi:MAG TPA: hypothetical protein VF808_05230 [Ktedonobacterales bacterium]